MFLIEKIENALQLICLGVLTGLTIYQAFRKLKMQISMKLHLISMNSEL